MRICFFGDSFVNGTGDDDALGWVGRVVARARQAGRDVTAYNLGIRRDTSADVGARWMREARLRLLPEHDGRLVFSFGANDCSTAHDEGGPRVKANESLAHARAILEAARDWLPTLMIGPASLAGQAEVNDRIGALSAQYASLCEGLAVPYLDICRLTLASPVWTQEVLAGDGAHPNRGGYQIVADAVANWSSWREWSVKPPEGEVRDAEEGLRAAMLANDVPALAGLLHEDLVFTAPDGAIVRKKDDLAAHAARRLRLTRLDLADARIDVDGVVATVTVRAVLAGTFDGSVCDGTYRYTRTWRKEAGRWQVISGSVSAEPGR